MTTQMSRLEAAKAILSPPGDTLLETIENLGISQTELAERMDRPLKLVSEIIKGKTKITEDTALQLETVLGISANFWLERERRYQLELAKIRQEEELLNETGWAAQFPIAQMVKYGWIQPAKSSVEKVHGLCNYFGVTNGAAWSRIFMEKTEMARYRISLVHTHTPHAISVWLQKGDVDARQMKLAPFNKVGFETVLTRAKDLSYNESLGFHIELQQLCASVGLALVYTPCLPKAPVSGCARWLGDLPIIQLSGRYKSNDRFWFTFFHEACHILKHGKKGYFLEEVEGVENPADKEAEANQFAGDWLVPPTVMEYIYAEDSMYEPQILDYADRFRIHPGILVGRLQHEGILKKNWLNKLKSTIELFT